MGKPSMTRRVMLKLPLYAWLAIKLDPEPSGKLPRYTLQWSRVSCVTARLCGLQSLESYTQSEEVVYLASILKEPTTLPASMRRLGTLLSSYMLPPMNHALYILLETGKRHKLCKRNSFAILYTTSGTRLTFRKIYDNV